MRFHVAALEKETVGAQRRYTVDEPLDLDDESFRVTGPARGAVRLMRTNQGILASVELGFPVELACGRCLTPFSTDVRLQFSEEYKPSINIVTGLPIALDPDDDSFQIDGHHILDVTEAVRQYALTELPMLPLCRADCAGLCPNCGARLNDGPCACPPAEPTGALSALRGMLRQRDDQ